LFSSVSTLPRLPPTSAWSDIDSHVLLTRHTEMKEIAPRLLHRVVLLHYWTLRWSSGSFGSCETETDAF
jgi:hypothetical protein